MKHAIPALALLALTAAACGGGDSKTTSPAEAPKTTAAAPTATPAPAATPAATTAQTAPAATGAPTAADKAEADKLYATRCTPCHGSSGKGDGAAAAALNPKPRNYMDKAWQAATKDETIAKAIVGGGTAIGMSALMPPNPDLATKPAVVQALVDKIRGFAN